MYFLYPCVYAESNDIEVATAEIFRFIAALKNRAILTPKQAELLEENLDESNLLFAAYSVAVSANDVEYFASICKDISQSLESEQGRLACEAQDEVLQICDQLFLSQKISENQLLYLRHLVLVRDEDVADIYDEFQDKKIDLAGAAQALFELANSQSQDDRDDQQENEKVGGRSAAKTNGAKGSARDDDDEDVSEGTIQLSQIVVAMIDQEILSVPEAEVLVDMVRQKNEYVLAAFELFFDDKNEEELTDTLLRYEIPPISFTDDYVLFKFLPCFTDVFVWKSKRRRFWQRSIR